MTIKRDVLTLLFKNPDSLACECLSWVCDIWTDNLINWGHEQYHVYLWYEQYCHIYTYVCMFIYIYIYTELGAKSLLLEFQFHDGRFYLLFSLLYTHSLTKYIVKGTR